MVDSKPEITSDKEENKSAVVPPLKINDSPIDPISALSNTTPNVLHSASSKGMSTSSFAKGLGVKKNSA